MSAILICDFCNGSWDFYKPPGYYLVGNGVAYDEKLHMCQGCMRKLRVTVSPEPSGHAPRSVRKQATV